MTIINVPILYNSIKAKDFVNWMDENVGRFNEDWYSLTVIGSNISIKVTDPQKATLVALRWGLK